MWGMIARITTVVHKRDEMIGKLQTAAAGMPGCLSYVVAKDASNEEVLWVTEVWESEAKHEASRLLPQVRTATAQVRPLVARFEKVAITQPIWWAGMTA